jgi:selenocysteine lyase/cysteine desulfurase/dTDP-4-dehydrorhamnose reductase
MEHVTAEYPNKSFDLTYFDSAGRSVLPSSVEQVGISALRQKAQPWNGVGSEIDITDVRQLFASLIECNDASCIALTPSTGFAMTMAAANILRSGNISAGKTILTMNKEMGSVVYPWQEVCKSSGATLKVISDPFVAGKEVTWTEALLAAFDESVAVIALPAVHWCCGASVDLAAIAARRALLPPEKRPYFIVDGTQSLGVVPFNAVGLDVDFIACSVHKWLNAPYGMSLVYVAPRHHATWQPLDHHERGRLGSDGEGWDEIIFTHPTTGFYPEGLYPDARRLDAGGKANPIVVPMVRAALQFVLRVGVETIQQTTRALTNALADQLLTVFREHVVIRPEARRSAHIFGVRFRSDSPYHAAAPLVALNAALKANKVYCSVRGEWLRVSVYVHNTLSDVRRFVSLLTLCAQEMLLQQQLALSGAEAKTVLITGGAGWLAQFLAQSMLPQCVPNPGGGGAVAPLLKLHVTHNGAVPHWIPVGRRHQTDISVPEAVNALVADLKPDIIIHTAALSSPVACHKDVHRAYAVNCPASLIAAVQEHVPSALFVFTSTDMVYGGERAPYRAGVTAYRDGAATAEGTAGDGCHAEAAEEGADPPVNVYGQGKLAFERLVRRLRYSTVLRLSNMIGKLPASPTHPRVVKLGCVPVVDAGAPYVYNPAGCKFLEWVYGAYSRRELVGLKTREIRSFVYVQDVVSVVLELARRYLVGEVAAWEGDGAGTGLVLNVGGPRPQSRLQVAQSLCTALGSQLVVGRQGEVKEPPQQGDEEGAGSTSARETPWKVYVLDEEPPAIPGPGELVSPRDIAMDSTCTEQLLGLTFADTNSVLLSCLSP